MMTRMRQMSKFIFILIAAAFIGLIVFEWGADVSRGGTDLTVGEINGEKLSYTKFNDIYQQIYQSERARRNNQNMDEQTLDLIRDQVWEQFIQQILFKEQMEKLNISATDSEVVYHIINYPLEEIKSNPSLQTNGVFDMAKYRNVLNDPNLPWGEIENYYRTQIPYQKLRSIITNSVRVSESEVMDEYKSRNLRAKVEYLAILSARFQDDVQVSDNEMNNYYNEHKEDYTQNEARDLSYVIFPIVPTTADTNRLYDDISKIKERLALGEDFGTLALEYSEDPTVNSNKGDLGYFDREAMVKPFSDAAFAADINSLIGPVKTQFGYHLIKVEDKKVEDGKEQVKASHILLKITAGSSTLFEQEDNAKSFSNDAQEKGWDEAIGMYHVESKNTGFFDGETGTVPNFGRNPAISNFAFINKLNDVSGVYSVDQGYAVFKINQVKESGFKPFEEVKNLVENKVKLIKAKELARKFSEHVAEQIQFKTLKEIADADTSNKIKHGTSDQFTINQPIPGIGKYPEFSATAFTLKEGEYSGMIEAEYGFYFQKLLEKTPFDSVNYKSQKQSLQSQLLSQKKSKIFNDWYQNLKKEANIVDNRKKYNIY